jgi:hypothetical protein
VTVELQPKTFSIGVNMNSKQAGLILIVFVAAALFCGFALNFANGQEAGAPATAVENLGACSNAAEVSAPESQVARHRYVLPYRHRHAPPVVMPKKAQVENECRRERKQPQHSDGPVDPVKNVASHPHRQVPWFPALGISAVCFGIAYLATYKRVC